MIGRSVLAMDANEAMLRAPLELPQNFTALNVVAQW
jgi:hypothetical protein